MKTAGSSHISGPVLDYLLAFFQKLSGLHPSFRPLIFYIVVKESLEIVFELMCMILIPCCLVMKKSLSYYKFATIKRTPYFCL